MSDKHRHRVLRAPQGFLPNWVLVVFAAAAIALVGFARSIG